MMFWRTVISGIEHHNIFYDIVKDYEDKIKNNRYVICTQTYYFATMPVQ